MDTKTKGLLMEIARKIKAEGDAIYGTVDDTNSLPDKIEKTARSAGFDRASIIVLESIT